MIRLPPSATHTDTRFRFASRFRSPHRPLYCPQILGRGHHMASFEPRGNSGRAVVRLSVNRKKSKTFDTLREAKAWASEMERKKSIGEAPAGSNPTVGELFEAYLAVR